MLPRESGLGAGSSVPYYYHMRHFIWQQRH